jgi:hypothetical protein
MQIDNEFLQANFQAFQQWHHWHDKAISLRKTAIVLYRALIPELRKYDKAYRAAQKKLTAQKKLKKRTVVPIRYTRPDILPAFSIYGSALENAFKGILVSKDKKLISATHLSNSLKEHNLIKLARSAGVSLSSKEEYVLGWVTEVLIWKARYLTPTSLERSTHFFHKLDDVRLTSARMCTQVLDGVFARARKAMPRHVKRPKFGVLVMLVD